MSTFFFDLPSLRRRRLLQTVGLAAFSAPAWSFAFSERVSPPQPVVNTSDHSALPSGFPTQPPDLVREMVMVSHFDLKRVQQFVEAKPSLARAAWDWGFGDWESALGAASHMGNRPIAEYLLSRGAPPSLFSSAMLGHLDVIKSFIIAQPGTERIRGPHSISLLAHAKAGGEAALPVYDYLASLGDADAEPPTPLSQSDLDAILGHYPFGPGENDRIDVTAEKGNVTWTRAGTMGHPLFHIGGRVFYPSGAPAVRISFVAESAGSRMIVRDPDIVLSVLRN
jgi:hypothetical protein